MKRLVVECKTPAPVGQRSTTADLLSVVQRKNKMLAKQKADKQLTSEVRFPRLITTFANLSTEVAD